MVFLAGKKKCFCYSTEQMVGITKHITVYRHNILDFFSELSDYSDGN